MNMHVHTPVTRLNARKIAESLVPELQKLAPLADEQRKVPKESMELVKKAGLLQIVQPQSCGGAQLDFRTHAEVLSTLAKGCNATAWVVGVMHAHSWMFGHMSDKAQQEVYGQDPTHAVAAVIAPRGKAIRKADGSYLLSGFWPFASGNAHSDWVLLGTEVYDEAGAMIDVGDLLVQKSQLDVLDDWYVSGLQGTGSNSLKCKDIVVAAHRFVSLSALLENQTTPYTDPQAPALFKSQAGPVLGICIASGATGVARGALEEFLKVVPGKKVVYTDHISHEWQPLQKTLGEAACKIEAAEAMLMRMADDIDGYAQRGEKMPMALRGRIRADIAMIPRLCRDAVTDLLTIGGAAGLSLKSPIQRAARNLQATCMHGFLLYDAGMEIYGRVLLGQEPGTPLI